MFEQKSPASLDDGSQRLLTLTRALEKCGSSGAHRIARDRLLEELLVRLDPLAESLSIKLFFGDPATEFQVLSPPLRNRKHPHDQRPVLTVLGKK